MGSIYSEWYQQTRVCPEVYLETHFSLLGCELWGANQAGECPHVQRGETTLKTCPSVQDSPWIVQLSWWHSANSIDTFEQTGQDTNTALSFCMDYNSFVPSSIRAWNSLEDLVLAPSLQSFKLALKYSSIYSMLIYFILYIFLFVFV